MIFGAYSQVPPGTPHTILQSLLSEVYKPVLTSIYQNPGMKVHLYLSLTVLEWFELNHPEMNMLIADLVKKDQVELLTGPSDHAILSLLPPKDRSLQIEQTTTYIRKRFMRRPKTMWLYNQAWSPHLVSVMNLSTVDRLIISNYCQLHDSLYFDEPYTMQDIGKSIEVVPIEHRIEQGIHLMGQGEMGIAQFEELLSLYEQDIRSSSAAVMIDLDSLCKASLASEHSEEASSLFNLVYSRIIVPEGNPVLLSTIPVGEFTRHRGYLPMGWYGYDSNLNTEVNVNDMLTKYEELNHLYGRMNHVIELARIHRKNKDVKKRVEVLLRKAQNGAVFVRDRYAGCYRREYRQYVYRYLNEAENLLSSHEGITYPRESELDYDGHKEILAMSRNLLVVIHPHGGRVQEMNYLPTGWNYLNTFSGYHSEAKRSSMSSTIDGSFQNAFHDVLLPYEGFDYTRYSESHPSVHDTTHDVWKTEIDEKRAQHIISTAHIRRLSVTKEFSLKNNSLVVDYHLSNDSSFSLKGIYATEMNLALGTPDETAQLYSIETNKNRVISDTPFTKSISPTSASQIMSIVQFFRWHVTRFSLLHLDYSHEMDTIVGREQLYQHTLFLLNWQYSLEPGESIQWTVGWRIDRRPRRRQKEST